MADVDTSIYKSLGANNQAMSPLQVLQLITQSNANKLFQQTYDARQGIADAYKNNVDENGNLDTRGLQRAVATQGGFLAPEAVGQGITNSTAQFANQEQQQKYLQSTIGSLTALPNPTIRDVNNWAVNVARNTNAPPEMIQGLVDGAYSAGNDPKALKKYLATQGIFSLGTQALAGQSGPPTEAGAPTQISTGEAILRRAGVGPQSSQGVAPPVTTGQPTGMVTGMAPGFQAAAGPSGALMGAARARAANYGSDIYPMTELLSKLETLGPTGTGPGTHDLNTMRSFVQSNLNWLPGADKIIGDPTKIATYNEAEKYATQLAGSRASMFGHGTDQALATSLVGSPNTHISNLAGVDLTKAIIGLRRMEQAQILDADKQGVQPGQYSTWASRWATNVDPRAFMVDLYDPQQLQSVAKTLKTPVERQRFNRSVQLGIENGIITRPGGEHAPGE
jgi:hypothetical protein